MITEKEYNILHNYCAVHINKDAIWRSKNGETIPGKAPGTQYTWQFYLRKVLFNPEIATAVSMMYLHKIEKEIGNFDFQIAGLETASTPLIMSIVMVAMQNGIKLNAFSVRKNQKEYGLRNWIEGIPDPDLPVMVCDDLCNSQSSMAFAKNIIEDHGLFVMNKAFSVVNKRNNPDGKDFNLPDHMEVIHLFSLDDFGLKY